MLGRFFSFYVTRSRADIPRRRLCGDRSVHVCVCGTNLLKSTGRCGLCVFNKVCVMWPKQNAEHAVWNRCSKDTQRDSPAKSMRQSLRPMIYGVYAAAADDDGGGDDGWCINKVR